MIKNPILYNGASLTVKRVLDPASLNVNLKIVPFSTASMVLMIDQAQDIADGDWIRIFTNQGDAGVFVVRSIQTDFVAGTASISMEHAIGLLNDKVYFDTYNENQNNVSAQTAINTFLAMQSVWKLQSCAYSDQQPWTMKNTTVYSAIDTILRSLEDSQLRFDTTALPFKLYVERRPTEASCEMRMNRNIASLQLTYDKSRMYTRLYPLGKSNTKIDGDYVERNTAQYGIVERIESNTGISDPAHLRKWAANRLKRHAEPQVIAKIAGRDLSDATGETWDKLTVGTVCRVPLAEYGTSVCERIDSISWNDAINKPEEVTVTLSNSLEDVDSVTTASGAISSAAESSRGGGRAAQDDAEEIYAWIETTGEEVRIIGDRTIANTNWRSDFVVTWDKITASVKESVQEGEGDLALWIEKASTNITQTSREILLEAKRAEGAEKTLRASISLKADSVTVNARFTNIETEIAKITGSLHVGDNIVAQKNMVCNRSLSVADGIILSGGITTGGKNYTGQEITFLSSAGTAFKRNVICA